jgi:hypothetical protein
MQWYEEKKIHTKYIHIHTRIWLEYIHIHANMDWYIPYMWYVSTSKRSNIHNILTHTDKIQTHTQLCSFNTYKINIWLYWYVSVYMCISVCIIAVSACIYFDAALVCICMYQSCICQCMYLFDTVVSACIYVCICMYVLVYAQEYASRAPLRLFLRLSVVLWCWSLCSTYSKFLTQNEGFYFFQSADPFNAG